MTDILLPCPFCGSPAARNDFPALDGGENAGGSCIECTRCRTSSAVHFGDKENLVSSWNARVPPWPPAEDPRDRVVAAMGRATLAVVPPRSVMALVHENTAILDFATIGDCHEFVKALAALDAAKEKIP